MKKVKRLTALFCAVLMSISMMSLSTTTFATSKTTSLYCGTYKANCSLVSANKYSGMALTSSDNSVKFNTLYAAMFGTKVDKNGNNPQYLSGPGKTVTNGTSASDGIPVLSSSGGYYYAKMATAHIAIKNSIEKSTTLNVAY